LATPYNRERISLCALRFLSRYDDLFRGNGALSARLRRGLRASPSWSQLTFELLRLTDTIELKQFTEEQLFIVTEK
jgi:hypothetical protein